MLYKAAEQPRCSLYRKCTNMTEKVVLYQDAYGATYDVELPLTSKVNPNNIAAKLGLPSYIDMSYFPMKSAVVTIWAALNAAELHEFYPSAFGKKVSNKPIPVLLFGGAAVKIHCQHANGDSPLTRGIKDTDFIVPKKQGADFCRLMTGLENAFGTCFKSFRTKSDMIFNAMRQGNRYRIRTINGVDEQGMPTVTSLDVFCDSISLRHRVAVEEAFERNKENLYTIGLENLIMSKTQFIMDYPKQKIKELEACNCEYRILPYPYYAEDMVVLGMEEKDVKDVCAIFLDHPVGKGNEEIDADRMKKALEKDSKMALTVTLNLRNLAEKPETLARWMKKTDAATVADRIQTLLKTLPNIDKKWNKPWWDTAVETPIIQ